jgi:hypothetical protein
MLRITVELIPYGVEENKEVISEIIVANTGTKNSHEEYKYVYEGWCKNEDGFTNRVNEKIIYFDRRKSLWELIYNICLRLTIPSFGKWERELGTPSKDKDTIKV